MKLKIILSTLIVALILSGGYSFYVYAWDPSEKVSVKEDEMTNIDFLKDKRAVIYFSTTADQDSNDDGMSYAMFVDEKGQANSIKMEGLELGNITKSTNQVFIEDKNRIQLLGGKYEDFHLKKSQYTGERSGYLPGKDLFFSIYNTGFNKKGGYDSDVRYGNENGFKTGTIPNYLVSSGVVGDNVYVLANDQTKPKVFVLKEVTLDNKFDVKDLAKIETPNEVAAESEVLADQNYFYFIMGATTDDHNKDDLLIRVHKQTKKQDIFPLVHYAGVDDIIETIVFNVRQSAYLYKDELYFVDGLGDVYTFNTKTEQIQKKFSFVDADKTKVGYNEQVYFQDDHVYYFRFNPKSEKYTIDVYSLLTGKQESQQEITGIKEVMNQVQKRGKSIYSYGFMMLSK
ncbi:hypothetical protein [Bacillus sp. AFS029533]|uniref:hypothetical protein n=1 Tax=Bacillus sp. AFS029533 TaxID=2033494 RepID=UPI000BFC3536|nr:hypothetical protein [Bacillus sp. AFS029533]PGZ94188.1 hypothetical protein COE53_03155 [Bacillus sp. AFS029533]